MAGAGALRSTANDLLKYLSANLGLTESGLTALMEKTHEVRREDSPGTVPGDMHGNTSMAWYDQAVYQPPGMKLLGHGGGTGGYSSFIGLDKAQRRGVVVLLNQSGGPLQPSRIGWRLLQKAPLSGKDAATMMPIREVTGVGTALDLDEKTGTPRITRILPDSPASTARLPSGLFVKRIDDTATTGKSLAECSRLMRGPEGTIVRLELIDPERPGITTVELTRQKFLTGR
jgi:CubicO group peptidase (beta-lactamase class C family)